MTILASRPHYAAHLAPLKDAIPEDVTLVASYADLVRARANGRKRIVLMQHGIGQSYSDTNPAYPGGRDNADVGLFLVPNDHAGARWQAKYPAARVEVVGSPRLDGLPRRIPDGQTTVAVTFHWRCGTIPETCHAFPFYQDAVVQLAKSYHVIGHAHPRATWLPRFYARHGIEYVESFDEVCRRADVLLFDNTSAGYEFASTGRPVVVMNSPEYRRNVSHGLRFWGAAQVGVHVFRDEGPSLNEAVDLALEDKEIYAIWRGISLDKVYKYRTGATERAIAAIRDWAS